MNNVMNKHKTISFSNCLDEKETAVSGREEYVLCQSRLLHRIDWNEEES